MYTELFILLVDVFDFKQYRKQPKYILGTSKVRQSKSIFIPR